MKKSILLASFIISLQTVAPVFANDMGQSDWILSGETSTQATQQVDITNVQPAGQVNQSEVSTPGQSDWMQSGNTQPALVQESAQSDMACAATLTPARTSESIAPLQGSVAQSSETNNITPSPIPASSNATGLSQSIGQMMAVPLMMAATRAMMNPFGAVAPYGGGFRSYAPGGYGGGYAPGYGYSAPMSAGNSLANTAGYFVGRMLQQGHRYGRRGFW